MGPSRLAGWCRATTAGAPGAGPAPAFYPHLAIENGRYICAGDSGPTAPFWVAGCLSSTWVPSIFLWCAD